MYQAVTWKTKAESEVKVCGWCVGCEGPNLDHPDKSVCVCVCVCVCAIVCEYGGVGVCESVWVCVRECWQMCVCEGVGVGVCLCVH